MKHPLIADPRVDCERAVLYLNPSVRRSLHRSPVNPIVYLEIIAIVAII